MKTLESWYRRRRTYETLDRKRLGYRGYVIHNNKSKGYLEIFRMVNM